MKADKCKECGQIIRQEGMTLCFMCEDLFPSYIGCFYGDPNVCPECSKGNAGSFSPKEQSQ